MLEVREVLEATVTAAKSHKACWRGTGYSGSYCLVHVMKQMGWWVQ